MYSLSYNGTAFNTYGLIVRNHKASLARTFETIQVEDRAWSGTGQSAPTIISLEVAIIGQGQEDVLSKLSTIRGLLDMKEEKILYLDIYQDRYWMAQFSSLDGAFVKAKSGLWSGTLIFTCSNPKAYAKTESTASDTLALNESADYGGVIRAICCDDDYVYIGGGTTNKVWKLDKIDLSFVAEGPDYGGTIYGVCCDDDYIYYGGNGGAGQYDACKLLKSDMTTIVRGPDYGGQIYCICESGGYIYYGGDGGAGQYDADKLDKATMAVELRGPDYGGIIYGMCVDSSGTYIYYGGNGGVGQYDLDKLDTATMAVELRGPDYLGIIRDVAVDDTYVYGCGFTSKIQRLDVATMAVETLSANLGNPLQSICIDDDYIYTVGFDNVVYKLDIGFAAADSYVAMSEDYGDFLYAICLDATNDWLYIGGQTTQTVWKLDARHMPFIAESDIVGSTWSYSLVEDESYIYISLWETVYKYRKHTFDIVTQSVAQGTNIQQMSLQGDYLYIVLLGGTARKLSKDRLEFVAESAAYGGQLWAIDTNSTHAFIGGATTQVVRKLLLSDMSFVADSANYGGTIRAIKLDSANVYAAGHTTQVVRKYDLDLNFVADSANYGGTIMALAIDEGLYVYCGGATTLTVLQITKATMVTNATSAALSNTIASLDLDTYYVYAATDSTGIYIMSVSGLANHVYGAYVIQRVAIDDQYIYLSFSDVGHYVVGQYDKRFLWRRSDHEIEVTTAGTAYTDPLISFVYNGDQYAGVTLENQTTEQEFVWEGTALNAEELIADSDLWYVTLEGESAMSGVSGDFLQLAPGDNTLYIEDFVGDIEIDWTDRFA